MIPQTYSIRLEANDEVTLIPRIVQLLAKRGCMVRKLDVRPHNAARIVVEIKVLQTSPIAPAQIVSQLEKIIDVEQAAIVTP